MSERLQHTTASMREKMLQRYGDTFHHKHDKNHMPYRQHCRTHPVKKRANGLDTDREVFCSTGAVHAMKLRQYNHRLGKTWIH